MRLINENSNVQREWLPTAPQRMHNNQTGEASLPDLEEVGFCMVTFWLAR